LDTLHANGVRAYQPRAIALGNLPRDPNPPCKGRGGFPDLRPCRAQEPSEAGFPRVLPWAGMLRAFSAGSTDSRGEAQIEAKRSVCQFTEPPAPWSLDIFLVSLYVWRAPMRRFKGPGRPGTA